MKSNIFKILMFSFTLALASCMPDSLTKFQEDPPKKATTSDGGTVVTEVLPELHPTNSFFCVSGNGSATTESAGAGADIISATAIAAPFLGAAADDYDFTASPWTENGTTNPRHEFVVVGDGVAELTDLTNEEGVGVSCTYADDSATTVFDNAEMTTLTYAISSGTLPDTLEFDDTTGDITGKLTGFNELAAYTITVTDSNPDTATPTASDSIEIASSRPLSADNSFFTQYNGTLWKFVVSDATEFLPNHYIINEADAEAYINFIDYTSNTLYTTIQTPAGQEFQSYFEIDDKIDVLNPSQVPSGTGSYIEPKTIIKDIVATLVVGDDITGGADNFALHWIEEKEGDDDYSSYVDVTADDGLTPADDELNEWIRCQSSPDLSSFGIGFLDGATTATSVSFTDIANVTNWGAPITDTVNGEPLYGSGNMDRICEFGGSFSAEFIGTLSVKLFSYADTSGDVSEDVNIEVLNNIAQPYPLAEDPSQVTPPVAGDSTFVATAEAKFYFHYKYVGSSTDLATLIITLDDNANEFQYASTEPDENKVSNGRGTVGTITYIDVANNKLYVTLDANDSWAFVVGDHVDNTGTFLTREATIAGLEYTFQEGKDGALGTTVFEPQIALIRAYDRLDIDATGRVITPFGKLEFDDEFLKQIRINGTLTILDETNRDLETARIESIDLSPGAHSLTLTAASALSAQIQNTVNRIAYVSPQDDSANEKSYIDYSIDSYLSVVSGGCTEGNCSNTDLVLKGTSTNPEIVFVVSGSNSGNIVIENQISSTLSSTPFVITATDPSDKSVKTEFTFSVSSAPANLGLNRNLLLNVPSGSAFKIGSYISSNTGAGLGIVKDIFTAVENGYEYLDVQVIKGTFAEFDDIDNRAEFDRQKTYILGDGVKWYNAAVEMANISEAQEFGDSLKSGCTENLKLNRFLDGSLDGDTNNLNYDDVDATSSDLRGLVAYQWDTFSGDTSTLRPTANNRLYLQVERGSISTGSTILAANCANSGAFDGTARTVQEVLADHVVLTHGATGGTNFVAGLNITSDDGANRASGVVHDINGNTTTYAGQYFFDADAIFLTGQDVDNVNPYSASEATVTAVAQDHTFYLYRYEEANIALNLALTGDDTVIEYLEYDGNGYCTRGSDATGCADSPDAPSCLGHTSRTACEGDTNHSGASEPLTDIRWVSTEKATPPVGLSFTDSGISGTPDVNSDKQRYIVRATNPYGTVEHEFELKVYDHFIIKLTDDADTPKPDSYIAHILGYGKNSVPCRVTQEAMDAATSSHPDAGEVVDITCLMEGGESDLYYKGLDLTARTGDDMCAVIQHTPFYYYDWPYIETTETVYTYTEDYADPLCGGQPEYATAAVAAATYAEGAAPAASGATIEPAELCFSGNGGGDFSDQATPGPNCDTGTVTVFEQSFTATQFACRNVSGGSTTYTDFDSCYENNGTCTDNNSVQVCDSCSTPGDCSTCTTRTMCMAITNTDGAPTWAFTGSHNHTTAAATADCTADEGPCTSNVGTDTPIYGCEVSAALAGTDADCGGNQGNCVGGVGAELLSEDELASRKTLATDMTNETTATFSYEAPFDLGYGTNLSIVNYFRTTQCVDTDPATNYEFSWSDGIINDNDWLDYAEHDLATVNHPFAGGRNLYSYTCDSGSGAVARVRMMVREWDNTFDVTDEIDVIDPYTAAAGDNRMDDATVDLCGVFAPCNNRPDWDDYIAGGSNNTCGNTGLLFDFGGTITTHPQEKEF